MADRYIETFQSIRIYCGEDGYYGSNGPAESFGYADTVEQIRDEIADYWQGDEHGPLNGFFSAQEAA